MITVRESVLAAVFAKLESLSGYTVTRNRQTDLDKSELPAINQIDGGMSSVEERFVGNSTYDQRLMIYVAVAGPEGQHGQKVSDAYGQISAALFADRTLGGTCDWIEEDQQVMSDPEYEPSLGTTIVALNYVVRFSTAGGNPYQTS